MGVVRVVHHDDEQPNVSGSTGLQGGHRVPPDIRCGLCGEALVARAAGSARGLLGTAETSAVRAIIRSAGEGEGAAVWPDSVARQQRRGHGV